MRPLKSALVLGGGGARGLAHLGVLKALADAGLAPDMIVGTSFGAIVGACYALNPDADALSSRFLDMVSDESVTRIEKEFDSLAADDAEPGWLGKLSGLLGAVRRLILWNRSVVRESLVNNAVVTRLIDDLVGGAGFHQMALPFFAVAFDLSGNRDVVIGEGDVAVALRASSAIPGIFAPVAVGDRLLVDGAVFQELPTTTARQAGADFVLAVDVGSDPKQRPPASAAEVWERVLSIRGEHFRTESQALADVLIKPAVSAIHWAEFSRADECYQAGIEATRGSLDEIEERLRKARRRSFLRRLIPTRAAFEVTRVEASELDAD